MVMTGKYQTYTFWIVGKNTTMKLLHIGCCARAVTRDLGIMGINNPCGRGLIEIIVAIMLVVF